MNTGKPSLLRALASSALFILLSSTPLLAGDEIDDKAIIYWNPKTHYGHLENCPRFKKSPDGKKELVKTTFGEVKEKGMRFCARCPVPKAEEGADLPGYTLVWYDPKKKKGHIGNCKRVRKNPDPGKTMIATTYAKAKKEKIKFCSKCPVHKE